MVGRADKELIHYDGLFLHPLPSKKPHEMVRRQLILSMATNLQRN